MFGNKWEPGTATIIAKKMKGGSSSGQSAVGFVFVADVAPEAGAPPFRTEMEASFALLAAHRSGVARLSEYDVGKVLVDVKHQKAKFDPSDPQISGGSLTAGSEAFDAALEEPTGTPSPAADPGEGVRRFPPDPS